MKIIQAVQSFAYGDGVGNDIVKKQELYEQLGYECKIYAADIDERYKAIAEDIEKIETDEEDVFILHYSGYCTFLDKIKTMHCRKVLVYHNITPHFFFEDGIIKEYCEMGERQLPALRGVFDMYLGDSEFNLSCLENAGAINANEGRVLPIAVDFSGEVPEKITDKPEKVILFVGRVVQNKRVENIIKAFDSYYGKYNKNSRLYIAGNDNAVPAYTKSLKELAEGLSSAGNIEFTGRVTDERLKELFASADAYISMSEHEGFGIPLIEAMYTDVPVLAYDSAAVAETMGKGGVLLKSNKPEEVAAELDKVLESPELSAKIIECQRENVKRFSSAAVKERLEEIVEIIKTIPVVKRNEGVTQGLIKMELTKDIESKQPGGKLAPVKKIFKKLMLVSMRFQEQFNRANHDALSVAAEYIEDCEKGLSVNDEMLRENEKKIKKAIKLQQSLLDVTEGEDAVL